MKKLTKVNIFSLKSVIGTVFGEFKKVFHFVTQLNFFYPIFNF